MRQLDLFGLESEPQKTAPSQLRKAAMAQRATPPSPVSDTSTLVFADNKIGIKIKLKRDVTLTDDTTQAPAAPEKEQVALQQLTLEEAILALTQENATEENIPEEEAPAEVMPKSVLEEAPLPDQETTAVAALDEVTEVPAETPAPVLTHQPLVRPAIISVEEEAPVITAAVTAELSEEIVTEEPITSVTIDDIAQEEPAVEVIADEATIAADEAVDPVTEEPTAVAAPLAARSQLVRPVIIELEEDEEAAEEEAPESIAVEDTVRVAVAAPVEATATMAEEIPEPVVLPEAADTVVAVTEEEMPVEEAPAPVSVSAPAPLAARSQLVRPAIIEIEEEEEAIEGEVPVAPEWSPITAAASEEAIVAVEEPVTEYTATDEITPVEAVAEEVIVAAEANANESEVIIAEPEAAEKLPPVTEVVAQEKLVATNTSEDNISTAEAVIVVQEEPAPVAAPLLAAPAKIKAPKSVREPALPKKRGRKSFKEIDAETDMIQLPDDEALFEKQYYPISVVAGWFNVNASLLRFWENEFDILKPRKNRKGDRLFRPEDVKNLQVIYYLLRQRKFTIEGAKEYLKTNKKKADTNTQLVQSLTKLRGFLLEFKAHLYP